MVDIVGTLNAELWGIWSSFGGPESVMMVLEALGMLRGEREDSEYFDVEQLRRIRGCE